MCGIAGYVLYDKHLPDHDRVCALGHGIRQRGPDDEGVVFIDRDLKTCVNPGMPAHAAFFHTRFAVIDLSSGGHQPFFSSDGCSVLVFNGEIYNYIELKRELESLGVSCRTLSDTEVLAEGWRLFRHGLWPKLNGFWAVAIYDKETNEVIFCRDRLGVAPFYYCQTSEGVFFSSLIAPLMQAVPGCAKVDDEVLAGFLETGFKDYDERTFFSGVKTLPPACAVVLGVHQSFDEALEKKHVYWELPQEPWTENDISFSHAGAMLERILTDAVFLRLRADVPLAFELSGGLDSSAVVAAAASLSDKKMTAYTIRVRDKDESKYAACVAKRFGMDHRVLVDMEDDLPQEALKFMAVMEEPYDTPANYVHHRMLKRMRCDGFKVILTGAGGDEALAGYEVDFWPSAWRSMRSSGHFFQADGYEFARRFRSWPEGLRTVYGYAGSLCRRMGGKGVMKAQGLKTAAARHRHAYRQMDFFAQRLFHCRVGLLPYYLRSTDHYMLSIPIEPRYPFLDYRLMELGLKLPPSYLFKAGFNKYLLRDVLRRRLPREVLWRKKKMGFPFAFHTYFGPRQDVFESYFKAGAAGLGASEDYQCLSQKDPARLWRYIVVGMWFQGMGRGR